MRASSQRKRGALIEESPRKAGRRGRPTAERVAAIESGILSAALEVFFESGYEAATMEAIAERARISKGTLYVRYAGKEALFRAVLQDRLERWSDLNSVRDHLLPPDLGPRLRHHADTLRRMIEMPEFDQINRLIQTSAATFPDINAFWQQAGMERYRSLVANNMATASDVPPGAVPDWTFLASLFVHTFGGWYRAELASRKVDAAEISSFVDKLIDAILTVVSASAAAPGRNQNDGRKRR